MKGKEQLRRLEQLVLILLEILCTSRSAVWRQADIAGISAEGDTTTMLKKYRLVVVQCDVSLMSWSLLVRMVRSSASMTLWICQKKDSEATENGKVRLEQVLATC